MLVKQIYIYVYIGKLAEHNNKYICEISVGTLGTITNIFVFVSKDTSSERRFALTLSIIAPNLPKKLDVQNMLRLPNEFLVKYTITY